MEPRAGTRGQALLWNLPFGGLVLYPFKLLATWLHELSHGLAMIVTGAGFDYVLIYRDTGARARPPDEERERAETKGGREGGEG